jgi:hypothetical protein
MKKRVKRDLFTLDLPVTLSTDIYESFPSLNSEMPCLAIIKNSLKTIF